MTQEEQATDQIVPTEDHQTLSQHLLDFSDYDDLGKHEGSSFFEQAAEARREIEKWRFAGLGNRPLDHADRDFLLGSMRRAKPASRYRQLAKNSPPWFMRNTQGESAGIRQQMCEVQCFLFDHYLGLLEKRAFATEEQHLVQSRLFRCWPTMALWNPRPGLSKSPKDICKSDHLCPFCASRKVKELIDNLGQLALHERFLVVVALRVSGDQLCNQLGISNPECQLDYARSDLSSKLKLLCKNAGMDGGLIVRQMGPQLSSEFNWSNGEVLSDAHFGYEFRLAVIGGVSTRHKKLQAHAKTNFSQFYDSFDDLTEDGCLSALSIRVRDAQKPASLRCSLLGSRNGSYNDPESAQHEGAVIWHPWSAATPDQWYDYMRLIKGHRLFDRWGSWRGM